MSFTFPSLSETIIQHSMAFDLDSDIDEASVGSETDDDNCYSTPKACFSTAQSPPWEMLKTPCKKIITFAQGIEGAPLIPGVSRDDDDFDVENIDSNFNRVSFLRPRYSAWRHDAKAAVAIFRRCDDSLKKDNKRATAKSKARVTVNSKHDASNEMLSLSKPAPSRRSSLDLSDTNVRTYSALAA